MGTGRFFVRSSNHGLVDGQTMTPGVTGPVGTGSGFTIAALVSVTSLPGAGVYHTACGFQSGTAARECVLHLNGDSSGTVSLKVGATRIVPSTGIIPVADGRWYVIGATKASGSTTVRFFMSSINTGVPVTDQLSSASFADFTSAAATWCVGCRGASTDCWDGHIGMATYVTGQLPSGNARDRLGRARFAWYDHSRLIGRDPTTPFVVLTDLLTFNPGPILNQQRFSSASGIPPTTGTEPNAGTTNPPAF